MQPWEDIMALLKYHGLVGDDAARAPMLCSAPIDAASATLCAAELKICPTIPTAVPSSNMVGSATSTAGPQSHESLYTALRP
eukprot:270437-Prymnesium_polylepis.1